MPRKNKIILRTGTGVPTASDFVTSEPAWDSTNGKLYVKNAAGTMVEITGGGGGGGSAELVYTYATESAFPATGNSSLLYFATDTGRMYRWTGSVYVEVGPVSGGGGEDALLRAIFLPPAPTGFTATAGNAQVTLSWTAPTGVVAQAPITDYRKQFSADGGTTWTTFSSPVSTATIATVTGLTNGTAYVFRVAAVNAVGVGAYTAASASVAPVAFAPTYIAGLQLWTDASDASTLFDATSGGSLVAADGGVARWQDKSGNARHWTQATSGSRPLRKTNQQNGLSTLRFDGTNDLMSIASSTATFKFMHDGDSTLFVVYRAGFDANPNTLYWIIANGVSNDSIDLQTGFYLRWDDRAAVPFQDQSVYVVANSGQPRYVGISAANTFPANVFNLQTIVSNPQDSTIANRATIRRNGGSAVSVTTSDTNAATALPTANATQNLTIGASSGTATWFLAGDIAEIIMYDSALSDADRGLVESYLMSKWGIS